MHRSMIAVFSLIAFVALAALMPLVAEAQALCSEGQLPEGNTCVLTSDNNYFVYGSAFNGRSITGVDLTGQTLSSSLTPPAGWYEGKSVEWSAPLLDPSFIRKGTTLFGVAGQLDDDVNFPDCSSNDADSPSDSSNKNPACFLATGKWFYPTPFGGRSRDCSIDSSNASKVTNSPCWLSSEQVDTKIVRSTESFPNCESGLVSSLCSHKKEVAPVGYFYNTEFNGRSQRCCDGASGDCTISSACLITSSQVPAVKTTTNLCNENGTLANDAKNVLNCNTLATTVNGKSARFVYSREFGGRGDCEDNDVGGCWIAGTTKSSLSTGLEINSATQKFKFIAKGTSLFGIQGEFEATAIGYGSGAHRTKSATASSNQISYKEEKELTQALHTAKSQYHPIPKISLDSDGFGKTSQVTPSSSLGTLECGHTPLTATVDERIAACNRSWDGAAKGNAGQVLWKLVTRKSVNSVYYEVWKDTATGLLWSSIVHRNANWCRASGANNSTAVVNPELKSADPLNICDQEAYQKTTAAPYSACFEHDDFNSSIEGTVVSGKAGLGLAASAGNLNVRWRLPTKFDFILANKHGLRFVLPDVGREEWTATVSASNAALAWIFDSTNGIFQRRARTSSMGVRCVGR